MRTIGCREPATLCFLFSFDGFDYLPDGPKPPPLVGQAEMQAAWALTRTSVLKWILTEGDKFVLLSAKTGASGGGSGGGETSAGLSVLARAVGLDSVADVGAMDAVYGVVFNLGSLLGRLLLEPVEVTDFLLLFYRVLSSFCRPLLPLLYTLPFRQDLHDNRKKPLK
jgi:hypothetical protein